MTVAVAAAGAMVDDWSHHVEMMKDREHSDPAQYGRRWRAMVAAAPVNLDRFARGSLELTTPTVPIHADGGRRPGGHMRGADPAQHRPQW